MAKIASCWSHSLGSTSFDTVFSTCAVQPAAIILALIFTILHLCSILMFYCFSEWSAIQVYPCLTWFLTRAVLKGVHLQRFMLLILIVCVLYLCMDIQAYLFLCHRCHNGWHKIHNSERCLTCTDWYCISVCSGMIISSSCPEGCQVCLYALRSQDHRTRVHPPAVVAVLLGLIGARHGGHVADCVLWCHPQWRASVMLERWTPLCAELQRLHLVAPYTKASWTTNNNNILY